VKLVEMDTTVALRDQIADGGSGQPVVLLNLFSVPAEDGDRFMSVWTENAAIMKAQPGLMSTQLHRGIARSGTFLNYAVWDTVSACRSAFANPEFRERLNPSRTPLAPTSNFALSGQPTHVRVIGPTSMAHPLFTGGTAPNSAVNPTPNVNWRQTPSGPASPVTPDPHRH
jgi:heme-degrading monooxygenase HmoA